MARNSDKPDSEMIVQHEIEATGEWYKFVTTTPETKTADIAECKMLHPNDHIRVLHVSFEIEAITY
jgi:hypothetical protein